MSGVKRLLFCAHGRIEAKDLDEDAIQTKNKSNAYYMLDLGVHVPNIYRTLCCVYLGCFDSSSSTTHF